MDVLFLLIFFGFIAFAIWLGYVGYRVLERRRRKAHDVSERKTREP